MSKTTKSNIRKRLKPLLSLNRKYLTTYKDIKKYFKLLNKGLFASKLEPFNDIEIKDLTRDKAMGQVITIDYERKGTRIYKLEMDKSYNTKKDFLDTLAHEMVHLYQFTLSKDTGTHNKLFYSFKSKLKYLGLSL